MNRFIIRMIILIFFFSADFSFAQVKNSPITAQLFSGETVVKASSDKIWNILTDAPKLLEVMGYDYDGTSKTFNKIGDDVQVKVWGDRGNFLLVYYKDKNELRYTLDPDNGSYICTCRWILTPTGNETKVWFEERYTESSKQTEESLNEQVDEFNHMFKRLKVMVE